jgi:acyl-CoA thioester hydrolase
MEFRVYYADTDAGGVVYHASYLRYLEMGRTEFLRGKGLSVGEMANKGYIFPVVRLEVDYKSPAVLDDLLKVETKLLTAGKSSFTMAQRVIRIADGKPLAEAKVTLVAVNLEMKARRLPQELVQLLSGC